MNKYSTLPLALVFATVLCACDRGSEAPPSQQDGMNAPTTESFRSVPPSREPTSPSTLRLKMQRTEFA